MDFGKLFDDVGGFDGVFGGGQPRDLASLLKCADCGNANLAHLKPWPPTEKPIVLLCGQCALGRALKL